MGEGRGTEPIGSAVAALSGVGQRRSWLMRCGGLRLGTKRLALSAGETELDRHSA